MIGARKVLCPVDFSASSARALRYAIGIAVERGIPLRVMMVVETPLKYLDVSPPTEADIERTREALRELVREQLPTASRWQPDYDVAADPGAPAEEIARVAREWQAGLLVMGTQGRTGVGKWLFGSTTERMLRRPPCPLLAVAKPARDLVVLDYEKPRFAIERVLAATDFGEDSAAAVRQATAIAEAFGAEVIVAHVIPEAEGLPPGPEPPGPAHPAVIAAAERRLEGLLGDVSGRRARVSTLLLRGKADVELLQAAEERRVDLVVMGAAGRGGVHHNPSGLTTYRVVSHSTCPVLVVPAPSS